MIEPYKGRVYDPCCGSSGMFVQSEEFIEKHGGRIGDLSIFGQESNPTTWKLAKMNLALRGIEANLGPHHADTFRNDLHKDLRADFILANPPFNMSDWGGESLKDDVRWKYGAPPASNANFAWVQHMVHHLAPAGIAGFVLANGSMLSNQSGEGEIRKSLIEDDQVDSMIALPGQLFYGTAIPACLWFLTKTKRNGKFADRRGKTLFIDARKLGVLVDRVHRELTDEEIVRIAGTYHAWRGEKDAGAVVKACEGKSNKVAIVQGALSAAASAYTLKGVENVLAKHPEIKVVSSQAADWDAAKAKAITQTVLKQNPDLCGIVGFWDGMDIGTAAAVKEAGLTGKVFLATSGGGERKGACELVKSGAFDLDMSYDVPTQAADMAGMIKWLLSSGVKPGSVKGSMYTTLIPITKENASSETACWNLSDLKK